MSDQTVVINARAHKDYDRHLVTLAEEAGYKVSKKGYTDAFVPLAEFVKKPGYIENSGSEKIRFSSYPKGVPLDKVEDIVKLVQDFVIRINLAGMKKMITNKKYTKSDLEKLLQSSINVFKQRPEEKHKF